MKPPVSSKSDVKALALAERERSAHEKGKALPFYARTVTRELVSEPKRGKLTPSKRASR